MIPSLLSPSTFRPPVFLSCKKLNNLNSFFAIVFGLMNVAVSRLHSTWEVSGFTHTHTHTTHLELNGCLPFSVCGASQPIYSHSACMVETSTPSFISHCVVLLRFLCKDPVCLYIGCSGSTLSPSLSPQRVPSNLKRKLEGFEALAVSLYQTICEQLVIRQSNIHVWVAL